MDCASGTSKLRLDENTELNFCLIHFLGDFSLFGGVDMARDNLDNAHNPLWTVTSHTIENLNRLDYLSLSAYIPIIEDVASKMRLRTYRVWQRTGRDWSVCAHYALDLCTGKGPTGDSRHTMLVQ